MLNFIQLNLASYSRSIFPYHNIGISYSIKFHFAQPLVKCESGALVYTVQELKRRHYGWRHGHRFELKRELRASLANTGPYHSVRQRPTGCVTCTRHVTCSTRASHKTTNTIPESLLMKEGYLGTQIRWDITCKKGHNYIGIQHAKGLWKRGITPCDVMGNQGTGEFKKAAIRSYPFYYQPSEFIHDMSNTFCRQGETITSVQFSS